MFGNKTVEEVTVALGLKDDYPLHGYWSGGRLVGYRYHCPNVQHLCLYDCPNYAQPTCKKHDRRCSAITTIGTLQPRGSLRCAHCNERFDIRATLLELVRPERLRREEPRTAEEKGKLLSAPLKGEELRWVCSQLPKDGNSEIRFMEDGNLPPGISRRDGPKVVFDQVVGMAYEPGDPEGAGDPGGYTLGDPAA